MKARSLFSLLSMVLVWYPSMEQPTANPFPNPNVSPNQLFYIQRSTDANTVMYEANIDSSHKVNPEKPVNVYWIRYAEHGQRADLSKWQWYAAYGYQQKQSYHNPDTVEICLNAFKKRPIQVLFSGRNPIALITINGQPTILKKVFVEVTRGIGPIPKVHYIELFGINRVTRKAVYERINH